MVVHKPTLQPDLISPFAISSRIMAPFRWPDTLHDIALAREVAANRLHKPQDWDTIAEILSKDVPCSFSTSCREHQSSVAECITNNNTRPLAAT